MGLVIVVVVMVLVVVMGGGEWEMVDRKVVTLGMVLNISSS